MAESQDVNLLKRRGRRRLVGAVALALVAVIVLPMVFDPEPRQSATGISVRIPAEEDARFLPKLAAQRPVGTAGAAQTAPASQTVPGTGPAQKVPAVRPTPQPPRSAVPSAPVAVAPVTPETKSASAQEERRRAERALGMRDFVVQVAALGEDEKVKALTARLAAAKLPHYTEPVAIAKGKVTRVRVGPFETREAAERAVKALTALGMKPGGILERP